MKKIHMEVFPMAVLKCKMCGGDLNLTAGASIAECDYCGSVQTVPKMDDEKKLTLLYGCAICYVYGKNGAGKRRIYCGAACGCRGGRGSRYRCSCGCGSDGSGICHLKLNLIFNAVYGYNILFHFLSRGTSPSSF